MKPFKLDVCLSPLQFNLFEHQDKNVVVIDVLRASSTIATALEYGMKEVIPVASLEDAQKFDSNDFLIAAERNGEIVEGFQYGNSPLRYMTPDIQGQSLVLTTTNGTKCVKLSTGAADIVIGSFVNLQAITEWLKLNARDTVLFCCGWRDHFSLEDTLAAGALVHLLKDDFQIDSDSCFMAERLYLEAKDELYLYVENTSHFQRLAKKGLVEDISYCMRPIQVSNVPILVQDRFIKANHD